MNKHYITFGSSGQLYEGGWVEVYADSEPEAREKFARHFGKRAMSDDGLLRYCSIYSEKHFMDTIMYQLGHNCGAGCHEVIE